MTDPLITRSDDDVPAWLVVVVALGLAITVAAFCWAVGVGMMA